MEIRYLADGSKVVVRGKTDDERFVVQPVFYWTNESDDTEPDDIITEEILGDTCLIVDQVFTDPPIRLFEEEVQRKKAEIEDLKIQITDLLQAISKTRKEHQTIIDSEKWVIDLNPIKTAKTIAFFEERRIAPIITEAKDQFSFRVKRATAEKTFWYYTTDESSRLVDMKIGLIPDPDKAELIRLAKERILERGLQSFDVMFNDIKFATDFIPDQVRPEFLAIFKKRFEKEIAEIEGTIQKNETRKATLLKEIEQLI